MAGNKKYIFLILHYQNLEVTNACISSLLSFSNMEEVKIVVVDNGSPNKTGELLKEKWKGNGYIDILINQSNEGFSKGNNIGYQYIKRTYTFEYLVVLNSDVEIRDAEFCHKIHKIYCEDYFDVLGPDVYKEEINIHQNPEPIVIDSLAAADAVMKTEKKHYRFVIYYWLKKVIRLKIMRVSSKGNCNKSGYNEKQDSFVNKIKLHGSCLIFSTKYIQENESVFYPETFLYCEEDILSLKCQKKGYKILYNPEIQIFHLGSASSNLFSLKGRKKFFERRIAALEVVKKYISED